MAETSITKQGDFTGGATITVVDPPATGDEKIVFQVALFNNGSTDRTYKIARKKGSDTNYFGGGSLNAGFGTPPFPKIGLAADDEEIVVVLSATDANVHYTSSAINRTP